MLIKNNNFIMYKLKKLKNLYFIKQQMKKDFIFSKINKNYFLNQILNKK